MSWVNPVANANTIVIRNSIPDAPNGGGITATIDLYVDGVFRQAITSSSKQLWNYRNSTTNPDDPNGGGTPWHFYNEDRAFITGASIAGQTLMGNGSINGKLITLAGSTLAPGGSIGTLTVTNDIVLGGSLLFELSRTNAQTSDKLISVLGTITGGGTLTVTNLGPNLQTDDAFQLFSSAVSGFTTIKLPITNSVGGAYNWTNKLALDGSIQILTVMPANPLPGKIQFNVSGNTLNLSWPTNKGWLLQTQTNSPATGFNTNWATAPGSDTVTSTNAIINPANGAVFYRLAYP